MQNNDYKWDLRKMFPTDEIWFADMDKAMELVAKLESKQGDLATTANHLLETARLYNEIDIMVEKLMVFAHSNFHQDMSDPKAKELYELANNKGTQIGEKLSFMSPELMEYSYEKYLEYCSEIEELKLYDSFATDFFAKKKHVLSSEMESLLVRLNDLGNSFDNVFSDLTINDIDFPTVKVGDTEIKASEANYSVYMSNENREIRESYFKNLLGTYGKYINTITSTHYGSVKNDVFTAKTRNFKSARSSALFSNFINEEVYDNLITTVRENCDCMGDYIKLRKKRLGLDEVHFYDLFVPMVENQDRKYTFEEAKEIVLEATKILGDDYTALLNKAFSERWIDVYPAENKRTGAYSTGSYKNIPYILLNFTGTLDDVFTLAHELGHSMHTYYSNQTQEYIYSNYSIFCAEVASTLNELLVSDYLYKKATTNEQKALLLDKQLNDLRSTFFRQTMFADFENTTHKMVENGEPLVPDTLCQLHAKLNSDYYGKDFVVDKELSYEWARIPHFYSAFYVYQYATGISAATAIFKNIMSNGQSAINDYKKFLSGGSSLHPIDMLKVAGVDMGSKQPILDTIEVFKDTVAKLSEL